MTLSVGKARMNKAFDVGGLCSLQGSLERNNQAFKFNGTSLKLGFSASSPASQ